MANSENKPAADEVRRVRTSFWRVGGNARGGPDVGQSEDGHGIAHGFPAAPRSDGVNVSGADPAGVPDHAAPERDSASARVQSGPHFESLDIIKAILIILVVFAHLVEYFEKHDPVFGAVYATLSLYGLPLFVIVSGMVAKPLLGEKDYRKMFAMLLLPLFCLQPFYLALFALA